MNARAQQLEHRRSGFSSLALQRIPHIFGVRALEQSRWRSGAILVEHQAYASIIVMQGRHQTSLATLSTISTCQRQRFIELATALTPRDSSSSYVHMNRSTLRRPPRATKSFGSYVMCFLSAGMRRLCIAPFLEHPGQYRWSSIGSPGMAYTSTVRMNWFPDRSL